MMAMLVMLMTPNGDQGHAEAENDVTAEEREGSGEGEDERHHQGLDGLHQGADAGIIIVVIIIVIITCKDLPWLRMQR